MSKWRCNRMESGTSTRRRSTKYSVRSCSALLSVAKIQSDPALAKVHRHTGNRSLTDRRQRPWRKLQDRRGSLVMVKFE